MNIIPYTLAELDKLIGCAVKDKHGNKNFIKQISRSWCGSPQIVLAPITKEYSAEDEITVSAMCLALGFTFKSGRPCGVDNV